MTTIRGGPLLSIRRTRRRIPRLLGHMRALSLAVATAEPFFRHCRPDHDDAVEAARLRPRAGAEASFDGVRGLGSPGGSRLVFPTAIPRQGILPHNIERCKLNLNSPSRLAKPSTRNVAGTYRHLNAIVLSLYCNGSHVAFVTILRHGAAGFGDGSSCEGVPRRT